MVCGVEQPTEKSAPGFVPEVGEQPCAGGRGFAWVCVLQVSDYLP